MRVKLPIPSRQQQPMRQSLTCGQGREMMQHKRLSEQAGIKVYFCDPYSRWQRGRNERTNGLLGQHLPKGTDLSGCSQEQPGAIADGINGRPRKSARSALPGFPAFLSGH